MTPVTFVDIPPNKSKANRSHWANVSQALRDNPEKWGFVGNYSVGVANHIRNGRYIAFIPPSLTFNVAKRKEYVSEHWIVTVSGADNGRDDVYIMWRNRQCGQCEWCNGQA